MNRFIATVFIVAWGASAAFGGDAAEPKGDPVVEAATLHSIGMHWFIHGDDNQNATVSLEYRTARQAGGAAWTPGGPLFRVERGRDLIQKFGTRLPIPEGASLFAGSALMLQPQTEYELKLKLKDPDGGDAEKIVSASTIGEPVAPADMKVIAVAPGGRKLRDTIRDAQPGTIIQLQEGVYEGALKVMVSGEPGRPIIIRGAGMDKTILDTTNPDGTMTKRGIDASHGAHHVWIEDLTIRNAQYGLVAHNCSHIVVRRCRFVACNNGIAATVNDAGNVGAFFISDNIMEGTFKWVPTSDPLHREQWNQEFRGIELTGIGNIVCYNRVSLYKDAINARESIVSENMDFHNNDVFNLIDDAFELDGSQRNMRMFNNRATNCLVALSTQPIYGGPGYIFRNTVYNVENEPFKMKAEPSGGVLFHNTFVKKGIPMIMATPVSPRNFFMRNNLFIGTDGDYAIKWDPKMINCDIDYEGVGGGPFKTFLKFNGRFATAEEAREKAEGYKHVVIVTPEKAFASGVMPPEDPGKSYPTDLDLRPSKESEAIDAGQPLPGYNNGFAGSAPDIGAFELGAELPHYGPR